MNSRVPLARRLFAEYLGTALLVTSVVGSGVMATTLSPGDVGLQLLENSVATMLALAVLIVVLAPVSGAHFNPVVSLADWWLGRAGRTAYPSGTWAGYLPVGSTAHKQGRVAGENAVGGDRTFAGTVGTQVVRVFDLVATRTGLREQKARKHGFSPVSHRAVAKRIDTYATPLHHGMGVDAVSDLDPSYIPPLGSPYDAVQAAAHAWTLAHPPPGGTR